MITDGHMLMEMSMMLMITTVMMQTLEVSLKPKTIKLQLNSVMVPNLILNQQTEECLLMLDGKSTMIESARDL